MLNTAHIIHHPLKPITYSSDSLNNSTYSKRFINTIKLIVFVLVFQSLFYYDDERDLEIEEEIPEIQINILPTFLAKREKII